MGDGGGWLGGLGGVGGGGGIDELLYNILSLLVGDLMISLCFLVVGFSFFFFFFGKYAV